MTAALDARQGALAVDLAGRRISKDEFCRRFPVAAEDASSLGLSVLRRALRQRYADDVEYGLALGFSFGISPDYLDTLHALAGADWHTRHADVVDALDVLVRARAPVSADVLYRTALARYAYLDAEPDPAAGPAVGPIADPAAGPAAGPNVGHGAAGTHDKNALGVRCAQVLGNLRTRTAALRLGELLDTGNEVLAAGAERELQRILDHDEEAGRSGVVDAPATVRALAAQLLATRQQGTGR